MEAVAASGNLIASARSGDASAFALLLDQLWEPAYRLAFSMLRERDAAEDAVQDAAVKAWRNVRRLRPDTPNLRPWFLTIVANQCRSTRRARWWRVIRLANMPSEPSRREVNADDRLDLLQAMRALSDDQRLVLALRYFIDLPIDEVAQVLQTSPAATKSRILRALKALRPVLERE